MNGLFLSPPNILQRLAVLVIVTPSVQVPVTFFVLAGFLQHFMCFKSHALPHRWSMSGSMGRILFDVAGD